MGRFSGSVSSKNSPRNIDMKIRQDEIEYLIKESKLTRCFECGKCTASCPLAEFFGDLEFGYTPRAIIEKALLNSDLVTGDTIWYCLTCDVCTRGCPSGVCFRDFIEGLRDLMMKKGHMEYGAMCKQCGGYFLPTITQKQLLDKICRDSEPLEFLFLCPVCRRRTYSHIVKKSISGR